MGKDAAGHIFSNCCPLWNEENGSCRFNQGGLLIPVTEHIQTYCHTANHIACSYFMESCKVDGQDSFTGEKNRRRFPRIPGSFSFRISEFSEGSCLASMLDEAASTIDVSPVGLRVQSHRELPVNEQVCFSLNGDYAGRPIEGIGRVVWCRSLENAPVYHAGLAVNDPSVANLLRKKFAFPRN